MVLDDTRQSGYTLGLMTDSCPTCGHTPPPSPHVVVVEGKVITLNTERDMHRYARADFTKEWRYAAKVMTLKAKVPKMAAIDVEVLPRVRYHQDVGSAFPTSKAIIDGIVDARVIPNDTAKFVRRLTFLPPVVSRKFKTESIELAIRPAA